MEFTSLLTEVPNPMVGLDDTALIMFLNPSFERLLGWTVNDLRGQALYCIFPTLAENDGHSRFLPIPFPPRQAARVSALHRDGHIVRVEVVFALTADPNSGMEYLLSLWDITQQEATERALKDRLYRTLNLQRYLDRIDEASTLEASCQQIAHQLCDLFFLPICLVELLHRPSERILHRYVAGSIGQSEDLPLFHFTRIAALTRKPYCMSFPSHKTDLTPGQRERITAFYCLPFTVNADIAGTLTVAHSSDEPLSDHIRQWLEEMAQGLGQRLGPRFFRPTKTKT